MKKIKVSVIILVYNRAEMVVGAIDSVLEQRYKNFELIVIDDGSYDNTREVLANYKDKIKLIVQKNSGVSTARNIGIKEAKGEFVAFLDSDDLWLPEKLGTQINFFDSHPEAMICQTEEIWISRGKRINPKKNHKKISGMIFENSLALCLVSPSAVMIKKSLFDEVGMFDKSLPACEDYDLWLKISPNHPIFLIDTPLIIKRGGHGDQLSKMPCLDKYRILSIKKIVESGVLTDTQRKAALKMLIKKCKIYEQGCKKRGKTEERIYFEKIRKKAIIENQDSTLTS